MQAPSSSSLGVSSGVRSAAARLLGGGNGSRSLSFVGGNGGSKSVNGTGLNSGDVYSVSLRQQLQDVGKKLVGGQHYNKDASVNNRQEIDSCFHSLS
ncbi:hypothetical protein Pfo_003817 [Paulownia fortunei]|nr:hypothetical protein Pfo_003817 [Paulownia fortunei]